jgi:hypothetical protein
MPAIPRLGEALSLMMRHLETVVLTSVKYAVSQRVVGKSHTYDGVHVEVGGKASAGNKLGGKDFWDD